MIYLLTIGALLLVKIGALLLVSFQISFIWRWTSFMDSATIYFAIPFKHIRIMLSLFGSLFIGFIPWVIVYEYILSR